MCVCVCVFVCLCVLDSVVLLDLVFLDRFSLLGMVVLFDKIFS